ncbi:hypothetical protein CHS0354_022288 [Potamilus streckersoni]|uniref:Uncharacterized protein n=1 Tax=Potamilus streckersoni TaxID=2493646 RepID=A0AAE0TH16_9BIVA|nr:hypothetical protein CHS0354_022288 [Potamilus streckersoni]
MQAAEGTEEETMYNGITYSSSSDSSVSTAAVTIFKRRCNVQSSEASVKFKKTKFAGQVEGCGPGYKLNEDREVRAEFNYSPSGIQPVRNLEIYNGPFQKCYSTQHNNEADDERSVEELTENIEFIKSECFDASNPSPSSFSFIKYQSTTHKKVEAQSKVENLKCDTDDFPVFSSNEEQNVTHMNENFQSHDDESSQVSYCDSSNIDVVENCSLPQSSTSSSDSSPPSLFGFQPVRHQGSLPEPISSLRTRAQEMPQLRTPNFHNTARHAEIDLHELWQNQLTAKAIVDNAINKTLEEMELSPDKEANMLAAEMIAVEDQGISAAIRSRGLVTARSMDQSPFSSEIWSHIPEFSETVLTYNRLLSRSQNFSDNMQQRLDSGDHISRPLAVESYTSIQNTNFIDQAVAMAISSQGLAVRRASL